MATKGKSASSTPKETKTRDNIAKAGNIEAKSIKTLVTKEKLELYNKRFDHSDRFLSNSLLTHANKISSPRENMFNQQLPQFLMLLNPDVPEIFTGYEHEVGKYSKSYYQTDRAWKVVEKISKFKNHPDLKYYLVLVDNSGYYDVVDRELTQRLTESYGYFNNNENIDSKQKGSSIASNEILYKSTSFDEHMNYRYGKNVRMAFISIPQVTEDAVVISKSLQKSMTYCSVSSIETSKNTNEIFLNIYGNDKVYKTFPDINEPIQKQVICAKRRMNNKSMLYNLKDHNLRNIHIDEDDVYFAKGIVIDIEIFSNKKIDEIERTPANAQLLYYYEEQQDYYKRIKSILGKIITNNPGKVSDRLLHIYHRAEDLTSNKAIINNNTKFENINIIFTVSSINKIGKGYKLTGRYGEKGVVGSVWDDEKMPVNQYGERCHMISSPQGVFGRLNLGQWDETELTFLAHNVVRDLRLNNIPAPIGFPKIIEFLNDIYPPQASAMGQYVMSCKPAEQEALYADILTNGLKICQPPFWDNVSFETKWKLFDKYKYPRYKCKINGKPVINRIMFGTKYVMLMKQTPPSKYSARSLGMLSALGHPSKSIRFKKRNLLHSDTPIRIGEMELMILCTMNDANAVAQFLSIYANSQYNRESFIKTILTTDNPLCIRNVETKMDSINRKMINAYFRAGGCELVNT